jgi:GNAT superfamily N-acetyltransferase
MMTIEHAAVPARSELVALYEAVGWTAYTRDPDALERAVRASTWVATARVDGALIGFARALSDEVAIAWLQDVLVHPSQQRAGVGSALLRAALDRFALVRTFALLTDDRPEQHLFYRSMGLEPLREAAGGRLHGFVRVSAPKK